jgi:prophage regulatory protein
MLKRFLRLPQVMQETGKSRSSIYEEMANGSFPKCFPIGNRAVAWYEAEIESWKWTKLQAAGKEAA